MASAFQRSIRAEDANGNQFTGENSAALKGLVDPSVAPLDDELELLIDHQRAAPIRRGPKAKSASPYAADAAIGLTEERLRRLSDEVSRVAGMLARLATEPRIPEGAVEQGAIEDIPEVSAEMIRQVVRMRRLRGRYFGEELFADPAWDILLDLLQAEISHFRVPISSLCMAAGVPPTTALRWVKSLVEQGLLSRRADPHDGRRVFVELAPQTRRALCRYFAKVGQPIVI